MPMRGDVRSATVPGLRRRLAGPAPDGSAGSRSPTCWPPPVTTRPTAFRHRRCWRRATRRIAGQVAGADDFLPPGGLHTGDRVRRPLVASHPGRHRPAGPFRLLWRTVRRRPARPRRPDCSPAGTSSIRSRSGIGRCGRWPGTGRSGRCRRRRRATCRWPAPGSPTVSSCPTTRTTRPGRTCSPRPPGGRATTGTRCCSIGGTDLICSPTSGSTPAAPRSTRTAGPGPPSRRRAAAPCTCAWSTGTGWASR